MSTVAFTRLIEAPADELWRVLTDLPARPRWLCTVDRVEVLTPHRFGAGTAWRESRTLPDGTTLVEQYTVQEATSPVRLVVASTGEGVDYRTTYTLRAVAARRRRRGRTLVTVVQEGVPTARYGRLLAVVFGGLAARAVEGALRRDLADLAAATVPGRAGPAVAA